MIDWGIAEQVGRLMARAADSGEAPRPDLIALAAECEVRVRDYTRLEPGAPLPTPEAVDRGEWIAANVNSTRAVLDPISGRMLDGLGSGPLAGPLRAVAGAVIGAEVGLVLGLASQRVLGQYDLALIGEERPPRLLYVLPNLGTAARALDADPLELARWITLHELTHAHQFGGVPWLRGHVGGLLSTLLAGVEVRMNAGAALRLPAARRHRAVHRSGAPRGAAAIRGEP